MRRGCCSLLCLAGQNVERLDSSAREAFLELSNLVRGLIPCNQVPLNRRQLLQHFRRLEPWCRQEVGRGSGWQLVSSDIALAKFATPSLSKGEETDIFLGQGVDESTESLSRAKLLHCSGLHNLILEKGGGVNRARKYISGGSSLPVGFQCFTLRYGGHLK